jgi:hypothetical protein
MGLPDEQSRSWEAITEAVERELLREFRRTYPVELIEATARESVLEIASEDVRIRSFVPVLASSRARRRLRHLERRAS